MEKIERMSDCEELAYWENAGCDFDELYKNTVYWKNETFSKKIVTVKEYIERLKK